MPVSLRISLSFSPPSRFTRAALRPLLSLNYLPRKGLGGSDPRGVPSARRLADHHQHHLESLDRLQGVGHVGRHQDHLILAEAVGHAADGYLGHTVLGHQLERIAARELLGCLFVLRVRHHVVSSCRCHSGALARPLTLRLSDWRVRSRAVEARPIVQAFQPAKANTAIAKTGCWIAPSQVRPRDSGGRVRRWQWRASSLRAERRACNFDLRYCHPNRAYPTSPRDRCS